MSVRLLINTCLIFSDLILIMITKTTVATKTIERIFFPYADRKWTSTSPGYAYSSHAHRRPVYVAGEIRMCVALLLQQGSTYHVYAYIVLLPTESERRTLRNACLVVEFKFDRDRNMQTCIRRHRNTKTSTDIAIEIELQDQKNICALLPAGELQFYT